MGRGWGALAKASRRSTPPVAPAAPRRRAGTARARRASSGAGRPPHPQQRGNGRRAHLSQGPGDDPTDPGPQRATAKAVPQQAQAGGEKEGDYAEHGKAPDWCGSGAPTGHVRCFRNARFLLIVFPPMVVLYTTLVYLRVHCRGKINLFLLVTAQPGFFNRQGRKERKENQKLCALGVLCGKNLSTP